MVFLLQKRLVNQRQLARQTNCPQRLENLGWDKSTQERIAPCWVWLYLLPLFFSTPRFICDQEALQLNSLQWEMILDLKEFIDFMRCQNGGNRLSNPAYWPYDCSASYHWVIRPLRKGLLKQPATCLGEPLCLPRSIALSRPKALNLLCLIWANQE